jgi:hypothetical protein
MRVGSPRSTPQRLSLDFVLEGDTERALAGAPRGRPLPDLAGGLHRALGDRTDLRDTGAEFGRVKKMTYAERRAWLRRLGVEVTVAKSGSHLPRYEIALNIPIEIREQHIREPRASSCRLPLRMSGISTGRARTSVRSPD